MGILDGLIGGMLGGMQGSGGALPGTGAGATQRNPLLLIALQLLQQNGGLQGILSKFQQAGYGAQADSWVSTGQNMPISAAVISQALGHGQLGQIAQQLGMSQGDTAGGLASLLPQLIDGMTPQGQVPADHQDVVAQTLALLQKRGIG